MEEKKREQLKVEKELQVEIGTRKFLKVVQVRLSGHRMLCIYFYRSLRMFNKSQKVYNESQIGILFSI